MDPNIMKLLEEDEDETMHSGADVEAFTAALNRDIGGDTSTSQPSDSDNAAFSQEGNSPSGQLCMQWQPSNEGGKSDNQTHQVLKSLEQQSSETEMKQSGLNHPKEVNVSQAAHKIPTPCQQDNGQKHSVERNSSEMSEPSGLQIPKMGSSQIPEPSRMHNLGSESQFPNVQKFGNPQASATEAANNNSVNPAKQIPFGSLLPLILPELDKDRAMQLQTLYAKLRRNEIPKEGFVRMMRGIVGDQMLRLAVLKMQAKGAWMPQTGPNQFQMHFQNPMQQHHLRPLSNGGVQFPDHYSFAQLHQTGSQSASADPSRSQAQKSREMDLLPDSHGMQINQMSGLNKQQQQLHFPQASVPMYGAGNFHSYAGTNVNTSTKLVRSQPHDSQMTQAPVHQGFASPNTGGARQGMNVTTVPKFEKPSSFNEPKIVPGAVSQLPASSSMQQYSASWQPQASEERKRGDLQSMGYVKQEPVDQANDQQKRPPFSSSQGSTSFDATQVERGNAVPGGLTDELSERQSSRNFSVSNDLAPQNCTLPHMIASMDSDSQNPSAGAAARGGTNVKEPMKKPSVGQKKPLEGHVSPPLPSKKQKISGGLMDQSIEHLNDVTAVSGVNIREEEEQLFSGSKEESRVSEASRRTLQEEEDRLILQKIPLQKKLAEIMTKYGLKNLSDDVERCLSLSVEERLRGLVSSLIRISKQRIDSEKPKHRTIVNSDVRQQILVINQKAREEWEKKQAEAEKIRKLDDPESSVGVDSEKEKNEGRAKSLKGPQLNKDEDDKMRTTAANVAARAAVGGDDMLSKWQLMAEQARQRREGGPDATSSSSGKDACSQRLSMFSGNLHDNQGAGQRDLSAMVSGSGTARQYSRSQANIPLSGVSRSISVKDVITVLEREPQTAKSTIIYRLYERIHANSTG